jgi:predicted ATPase
MIHRVRVKNFRSIRDVTVELSPVTVLVGRSGAGKSNFVDSIRFLRDLLSADPNRQDMNHVTSLWSNSRPATSPPTTTSFEITFSIPGVKEHYQYEITLHNDGPARSPVHERLLIGERCLFSQKTGPNFQSQWTSKPNLVQVPDAGAIAISRLPSLSEVVIAYTALTSAIGIHTFSDQVLSPGRKGPPRNNSESLEGAPGLRDDASNYLETLREIMSNLHDLSLRHNILSALRRVNKTIASVELDDIRRPTSVIVGHEFGDKILGLKLSQESDGLRRFYACLLAIYQSPAKQTLIFEHPEDGIHPGALSLLAEEFKSAPQNGRGQVILTTHSPLLLDHFEPDQIRAVQLDGLETRIGQISREQREAIEENLLDPGELLTVDPARIEENNEEPADA